MADNKKKENMASMSLGDHLEELRTRLILAISGLFVGLVVCMFFGSFLIDLLLIPYDNAILSIKKDEKPVSFDPSERYVINLVPYENAMVMLKNDDKSESFGALDLFTFNLTPYEKVADTDKSKDSPKKKSTKAIDKQSPDRPSGDFIAYLTPYQAEKSKKLTTISPSEGFMVYLKTSMIFGLLLSSPWVFWQIWAFVASGLYMKEKKFAHAVAPASAILFVSGSIFFMTIIAPLTMKFFMGFDSFLGFTSQFRPLDYINMILMLTMVFGLAFQMPILIVFAERMGLVTTEMLTKNRKFVVLGLVVASALMTPPDVVSQIGLAMPLYLLYEISIMTCKIIKKRKEKAVEI